MTCPECRRSVEPGETTWPAESGPGEVCQECWEDYCAREWWAAACLVTTLGDALYGDDSIGGAP